MITLGLGKGPYTGSLVAWGLGKHQAILFVRERQLFLVKDNREITVQSASRLLTLEGSPMNRIITLLGHSNVVEVSPEERNLTVATCDRLIVVDTEDRTVELDEEE